MQSYNESWRKHIDKHTIDLRNAQKPQSAKHKNTTDFFSGQTEEKVMRHFATMTPEEVESTQIQNTDNLEEYGEALRRSFREQEKTNASNTIHLADVHSRQDIQTNKTQHSYTDADRHSLLRELHTELASIEYNPPTPPTPQSLPQHNSGFAYHPSNQPHPTPAHPQQPQPAHPQYHPQHPQSVHPQYHPQPAHLSNLNPFITRPYTTRLLTLNPFTLRPFTHNIIPSNLRPYTPRLFNLNLPTIHLNTQVKTLY